MFFFVRPPVKILLYTAQLFPVFCQFLPPWQEFHTLLTNKILILKNQLYTYSNQATDSVLKNVDTV
jgi:hypothetical protein